MSLLILLNCCTFLPPSFLHFLLFLQIASCHPLQHTYIMSLLQRLLEPSYPSLEVQMQVSIAMHTLCNTVVYMHAKLIIKHFPICIVKSWLMWLLLLYFYKTYYNSINLGHYYFKRKSNTSKLRKKLLLLLLLLLISAWISVLECTKCSHKLNINITLMFCVGVKENFPWSHDTLAQLWSCYTSRVLYTQVHDLWYIRPVTD